MDHLRTSTVSDSFPISPKHVVEHCHIDRRVSIAHFSDDSAQPVAPDQSADAYSAIPMDNAATISSLVSVIFLRTLLLVLCQLHVLQRAESQLDG